VFPEWALAGWWGLFAGTALLLGAAAGYWIAAPPRVVASVMAFGSGVLLSAISFELLDEAFALGGADSSIPGLVAGGLVFTTANVLLARRGAKHRKRSGSALIPQDEFEGSGLAIAAGSVMDGIPESIAIGLTLLGGATVSIPTVLAIFLSNIPEGLSSSAGLKARGWRARSVLLLWAAIAAVSGVASLAGYVLFGHFGPGVNALVLAFAAGGVLAMVADTMIPEAFSEAHSLSGMVTVLGFATSFLLSKLL